MSGVVFPIHIGELNGKLLRFFKAPTDEPQLVWHAWDDLVACASLPRDLSERFQRSMRRDYPDGVRTIGTTEGILTIAPHWMALGFIGSMIENKRMPASAELFYTIQSVDAWNALTGDLCRPQGMDLFLAALQNTNKNGGGEASVGGGV
ncbi:hypothetical protein FV222_04845 [Methylobacterium sp. WL103]|uniref:hypothetical protein n=1 Tax=Methylobacterium sp. WL103 TaxID=2603891 RepID=UPI0011CC68DD|nr:hypothetical protein [Methylobacterium sp. WL103]TXN06695.1 hypothetical protein FV222_04845 [Methylobacterium sp. WL103]